MSAPPEGNPPRLYVILDLDTAGDADDWIAVIARVAAALDGREAAMLQLRVKSRTGTERLRLLERGCASARRAEVTVLANGTLREARRVGADGVHWPEAAIPAVAADPSPGLPLRAASVHSVAAARRAREAGADFAVFGPVFEPGSKAGRPRGLDELARVTAAAPVPILALGGIDAERVPSCLEHGARGVAVVSAVMRRADPGAAALELLDALHERDTA